MMKFILKGESMKRVLVTLVLFLLLCAVQAASPDLQFAPGYIPGIYGTYDLDTGDVDGDGDIDLLASSAVMLNDGKGIFTARTHPYCGISFRFADVDGDDDLDIAGINGVSLFILLNDGSANFSALPVQNGTHGNAYNKELVIADLNGDGALDIVDDGGALFINQGGGHFADEATQRGLIAPNSSGNRTDVAVLDANRDGLMDIFFPLTYPRGYALYIQKPGGTFVDETATRMASVPAVPLYDGADAMDLNGDGAVDILANNSQGLKILQNDGTGTFTERTINFFDCGCSPESYASSWAVRDLNLDGFPELVMLGNFSSRIFYGGANPPFQGNLRTPYSLPSGNTSFGVKIHVVDLTGDGMEEIIFRTAPVNSPGTVHYFLNKMPIPVTPVREVLTADMHSALEAQYTPSTGIDQPTFTWTLFRYDETLPAYTLSGAFAPLDGSATTSPAGAVVTPGVYRAELAVRDSAGRTVSVGTLGFALTEDFYDAYTQCAGDRLTLQGELAASQAALSASESERVSLTAQLSDCGDERQALIQDAVFTNVGLQEIGRLAALPPGQRRSTLQPQGSQAQVISAIIALLLLGSH